MRRDDPRNRTRHTARDIWRGGQYGEADRIELGGRVTNKLWAENTSDDADRKAAVRDRARKAGHK